MATWPAFTPAKTCIIPNHFINNQTCLFFAFIPAKKTRDLGYTRCEFHLITRLLVAWRSFVARQSFSNDKADGDGFRRGDGDHLHLYCHPALSLCAAAQD
jgi:hypothetical protein